MSSLQAGGVILSSSVYTEQRRWGSKLDSLPPEILQLIFLELLATDVTAVQRLRSVARAWNALTNGLVSGLKILPTPAPFELASRFPNIKITIIELYGDGRVTSSNKLAKLLTQMSGLQALTQLSIHGLGSDVVPALVHLTRLSRLKSLDLSRSELFDFPLSVLQLLELETLRAADCSLTSLTSIADDTKSLLVTASHLRCLDLSGNKLTALPVGLLWGMRCLTSLNVSGNKLSGETSLVDLEALQHLEELDVSGNSLQCLPAGITALTALTRLDAADCDLTSLEQSGLECLTDLQQLNMSGNWQLGQCSSVIAALGRLTQLDLSGCSLTGLPSFLGDSATQLVHLHLSANDLQEVPECISRLTQLRSLHLDFNNMARLPPSLATLNGLTALDVSYNFLTDLPPHMRGMTALKHLTLGSNNLERVPDCLANIISLQELDLSCNQLRSLPSALCTSLVCLDFLGLAGNRLTRLPPELSRLARLAWLDVADNRLAGLPPGLVNMEGLQVLKLRGNCLACPWPAAFKRWRARLRRRGVAASVVSATASAGLLVLGAASAAAVLPARTVSTPGDRARAFSEPSWPQELGEEDGDSDGVDSVGGDDIASEGGADGDMEVVAVEDELVGEEQEIEGGQGAEAIGEDAMGGDGEAVSGGEQDDDAESQEDGEEGEEEGAVEGDGDGDVDVDTEGGESESGSSEGSDSDDDGAAGGMVEEGDGEVEVEVAGDEGEDDGDEDDDDDNVFAQGQELPGQVPQPYQQHHVHAVEVHEEGVGDGQGGVAVLGHEAGLDAGAEADAWLGWEGLVLRG